MLLQVYPSARGRFGKSNLLMKGTQKIEVPNFFCKVFTTRCAMKLLRFLLLVAKLEWRIKLRTIQVIWTCVGPDRKQPRKLANVIGNLLSSLKSHGDCLPREMGNLQTKPNRKEDESKRG